MKWIKTAIGAVIAISVVPIVVLSFINTKKSLEPENIIITTEVSYNSFDGLYYNYTTSDLPMNDMLEYLDNDYNITLSLSFDTNVIDIIITDYDYYYEPILTLTIFDNNNLDFNFSTGSIGIVESYTSYYSVNAENLSTIDITFSKPSNIKNVNIITTILSLAPIVFVGGVLFYFYNPLKRRD